jgi:Rap1a immunity proteins
MKTFAAALIVVGCTLPADAERFSQYWYDGNQLYELCQKSEELVAGFSVAVAETAGHNLKACISIGVQANQIKDVVCGYLADNPQTRRETGFNLAYSAIMLAWPCP